MNIPDDRNNFFVNGILRDRNYRFVVAKISSVAQEMASRHASSPMVSMLLGEAMLGAFFLASHTGKQRERAVSLHLECSGPVRRIIAFANAFGGVRAMPGVPDAVWKGPVALGRGTGMMTVHRWLEEGGRVYTSSTEMRHESLSRSLEEFLGRSEQIQSFLRIETGSGSKDGTVVSGYLFQALPGASADDTDAILDMLEKIIPSHLIGEFGSFDNQGGAKGFTDGVLRNAIILNVGQFYLYCDCSRTKIASVLVSLGRSSAEEVLREYGEIEVVCEFCKKRYEFTPGDVEELFRGG
jgi:molecular chaperone Hsp33